MQNEESLKAVGVGPPLRPALAVLREIIAEATGEVLDVVQDNDPYLPPDRDLQQSEDATSRLLATKRSGPSRSAVSHVR